MVLINPLATTTGPTLLWPYAMPMPSAAAGGCGVLCCSRPPLTVLSLVGAGLGLPLSEEILVLSLGSQLPSLSPTRRLCVLLWTLVGVVASDLATVTIGAELRRRSPILASKAKSFGPKLLQSVGRQLSFEAKRDGKRLEEQLARRLLATARTATDLIARLNRALGSDSSRSLDDVGQNEAPLQWPRVPSPPKALRLTLLRRATCNTRTALATVGQSGPRILSRLGAINRQLGKGPEGNPLPSMSARLGVTTADRVRSAAAANTSGTTRGGRAKAFAAGVDNRLGLGQRWPLALLTGLDGEVSAPSYAAGSATAALLVTLPLELGAGALLQSRPWLIRLVGAAIAFAQLCRFGPLWVATAAAVADEVREVAGTARRPGSASGTGDRMRG